ncbi:hypothetical protein CPB85DRAFT_1280794 [Mucidula mucida]|nr:hypothetical protein CPB85DRAFT_1280794 [Mucidula mucida]
MTTNTDTFLGLELAPDQLRAVLLDSSQELVGTWVVEFDELEYGTRGGMYTGTGGESEPYTAPVEMWVRALDLLFSRMAGSPTSSSTAGGTYSLNSPTTSSSPSSSPLSTIRAISGCALPSLVFWKSTPLPALSALDPSLPLATWFNATAFSLPNTSVRGERVKDVMARVGGGAREVWVRTGRVQAASKFLESLVSGRWAGMGEAEAWASGMYSPAKGRWDEDVLDIVGGSREEGRRVRGWLGEVQHISAALTISRYLVERYGFRSDTVVAPFTLDVLGTYAGLCPAREDAVLCFGPTDTLIAQISPAWVEANLPALSTGELDMTVVPHPFQHPTEEKRYLALMQNPNTDVARALVRDMYTKSWSAFDRLVAIVPPGGSIGLDDKLFAFSSPSLTLTRFETGVVVPEFRDLRANPRCLVESQLISMRVRWGRAVGKGCFGSTPTPPTKAPIGAMTLPPPLPFDTITSHLPSRLLCTGAAANFPSIANVLCDVFGRRVYVGMSQIDSAQISPHRNAPARGFPGRAALGCALVARWAYGHADTEAQDSGPSRGPFEAAVHAVHAARWESSGGTWARTNVSVSTPTPSLTPTHTSHSLGYSNSGFTPGTPGAGWNSSSPFFGGGSGQATPTLAAPSPSLGLSPSLFNSPQQQTQAASEGQSTLVPISALSIIYPSEKEEGDLDLAQAGLARVADADQDAFLGYASVVGEWVRLEGVVRRGGQV